MTHFISVFLPFVKQLYTSAGIAPKVYKRMPYPPELLDHLP